MSGLGVGILSGLVVASVGVAALSLSSPLPPRDGGVVAVDPAGDGAVQAVPVEGTAPETDTADPVEAATDPVQAEASPVEQGTPELESEPEPEPEDTTPDAEAPATEIPLPAGTEFNRAPPEPEAALPSAETAPVSTAPQPPALAGDGTVPSFDTSPAGQPNVGADAPAALSLTADRAAAPASPAAAPAPAVADSPTALTQPDPTASPDVETAALAVVEDVAPEVAPLEAEPVAPIEEVVADPVEEEAVAPVAEEALPAASEGADVEPEASPDPVVEPLQTPLLPTIGDGTGQDPMTPEAPDAPAQDVAGLSAPVFPQTSSLPQAGVEQPDVADPVEPEEVDTASLPAIRAFATEFDATDARALIAVVLIDDPDSPIALDTLTRFTFPVAFAIDPLHPDAAMRAATLRDAGFEVVMLGSMIGEGATPADVEVAMQAAFQILPEAVALLDTPEGRIQGDRPVLDAVVGALAETGHGLVAFPRGLNAAEQSANRLGVPGATVFRMLDDEGQRATVITRFLARAAFSAGQQGAVIVVGHTRPDTVTALFSWALGGRSEGVALAPLSATIERAAGVAPR